MFKRDVDRKYRIVGAKESLKTIEFVKTLATKIIQEAQKVYDDWDESDKDSYAGGGICHYIADVICDVLDNHNITCTTISSSHEQHVYSVAKLKDGVYSIDIPWSYYETGGGFSWKKLEDVEFENSMLEFYRVSPDPNDYESYTED